MLCWGNTRHGQLGLGGIEDEFIATPTLNKYIDKTTRVKQVACGYNHTLFLMTDGTVFSCGSNDFDQLGYEGSRKKPG